MIRYIFISILFILLSPGISFPWGPAIFLGGASSEGTTYTNPLEPKNYGDPWGDTSCYAACVENGNCGVWDSPCNIIEINATSCSNFWYYCEADPGSPDYCDPGACLGGGGTERYYHQLDDWGPEYTTNNPLFKAQSGGSFNLFPLFINYPGTAVNSQHVICGDTLIDHPSSWWWWYNFPGSILRVYWWKGLYDDTWTKAYTAGSSFNNWNPTAEGWPSFMSEEYKNEWVSRCESQDWIISQDYSAETCSCTLGYPGAQTLGANVAVMLDTFEDAYGWNDNDAGDGVSTISGSRMTLQTSPSGTPSSDDRARRSRLGLSAAVPSDVMYITYLVRHGSIGATTGLFTGDYLDLTFSPNYPKTFHVGHGTNGLYVYNTSWVEVGTDINKLCEGGTSVNGCWQEWTFRVGITGDGTQAAQTFDAWVAVNGAEQVQVVNDAAWNQGSCCSVGQVEIRQFGYTMNASSIIEFITFGDDFY